MNVGMHNERTGSRKRFLDAVHHRFTGEVPFFELWAADVIVDQVLGRPMGGKHMLQLDPPDCVEFVQRAGIDAIYIAFHWPLGRKNKIDDHGRVHYVDGAIKTRVDLKQIKSPSLDDLRVRIESYLAAMEGRDLACVFALDNSPTQAYTAIGPMDYLLAMADDHSFLNEFMDRVEEFTLSEVEVVREYPIDVLFLTGPQCGKTGPIVSREMHEQFIFPRIEKMLDMIRPTDVPVILHSDGDNSMLMDWIVGAGFAGLHPIEPCSDRFNIFDLKRRFGRQICLCGNVDVSGVLTYGTPEEVRQDTLMHLRQLSPEGGYICGSSHDITDCVPCENFEALAETVCSYVHPG
jgi:hypothetical protein